MFLLLSEANCVTVELSPKKVDTKMQTFWPYSDPAETARCLDDKRLFKQAVEVKQIYNALTNPEAKGWVNHPATLMWKGCEVALIVYGWHMCQEWERRGRKTNLTEEFKRILVDSKNETIKWPFWKDDPRVQQTHRQSLLAKNIDHYSQFGWEEYPAIREYFEACSYMSEYPYQYYWPVTKKEIAK